MTTRLLPVPPLYRFFSVLGRIGSHLRTWELRSIKSAASIGLQNRAQYNLDITKGQGLTKYVCYYEVSLYRSSFSELSAVQNLFYSSLRGSFSYILLLLGRRISFVLPRTSLCRGPTVLFAKHFYDFFK